jgi:predicted ABC-type sugar transport system permease subunit
MNNQGMNGNMQMNDYSFMGMHQYWWITILVIVVIVFVLRNQYRKRK